MSDATRKALDDAIIAHMQDGVAEGAVLITGWVCQVSAILGSGEGDPQGITMYRHETSEGLSYHAAVGMHTVALRDLNVR